MDAALDAISTDPETGGLRIGGKVLHPLWLRERVTEPESYDHYNHQRLYEHSELPSDLVIKTASIGSNSQKLNIEFSDNYHATFDINVIAQELGFQHNPESIPLPQSWDTSLDIKRFNWEKLDDTHEMKALLTSYFQNAFCIMDDTPTDRDNLKILCRRFGFLRETNFGELFNVETKPNPSDLAYTDVALASHTDNPYREPVPGIQYLHCLRNEVDGGLSTLVDGMAVAEAIGDENPEWLDILEAVPVRFRYQGPTGIYENVGPLIARDHRGYISHIRFSSRVDFVPAMEPKKLDLFYAARRRMHELSNDLAFQIQFPFRSGTLLMMNNYRLFHGRTAFDGALGYRHLQGCYIDHDGPQALFRSLATGGTETYLPRES